MDDDSTSVKPIKFGLAILAALEATTFFLAATAHLERPIRLGPVTLLEPRIVPATIVESLCGLFIAVSVYAIFAGKK
jgi:hypothetical protein